MARVIYIVNATQVVVSEAHPEGVRSVIQGYPKTFDSKDYAGNYRGAETAARIVAEDAFHAGVKDLTLANNPARVAWTVTTERDDGRQVARDHYGDFPAASEPEEEEEEEEEVPVEG